MTPEELAAFIVECIEGQNSFADLGNGYDEVQISGWVDMIQISADILARIEKGR